MDIVGIFPRDNSSPENKHLSILDYRLTKFTKRERVTLTIIVSTFLIFSIFGNVATLYVNVRRRIRPFFRACLLSLACSDLLTTIFTTSTYLSQFSVEYIQMWTLGPTMCGFVPFITTTAIIVNSMTLVGIALDRYLAVVKYVRGLYEPGGLFCWACMMIIWGIAAGISSPMISSYVTVDVYIIQTDPNNSSIGIGIELTEMCFADKNMSGSYYLVLFSIVFIPIVLAFMFLNCVIAREIWNRRRALSSHSKAAGNSQDSSSDKRTTSDTQVALTDVKESLKTIDIKIIKFVLPKLKKQRTTYESRQLRMFFIILFLMTIFLICRLPTWIYLIMRLYHTYTEKIYWKLHFGLGILSQASCVLNPLFYTFLMETIQYTIIVTNKIKSCCDLRKLFCYSSTKKEESIGKNFPDNDCGKQIFTINGYK